MNISFVLDQVIHMAQELRNQTIERQEEELRARGLEVSWIHPAIYLAPSDEENRLRKFLLDQPVAVIYTAVLIMYVGRGDFPVEDFLEQYGEMRDIFETPVSAVDQMLGKVPLGDYLEEGLKLLKESNINVDTLLK